MQQPVVDAAEVDAERVLPAAASADPGVVEQHVERPELGHGSRERGLHLLLGGYVEADREAGAAGLGDARGGVLRAVAVEVGAGHGGTLGSEAQRRSAADAGRRAGDQRGPALEYAFAHRSHLS